MPIRSLSDLQPVFDAVAPRVASTTPTEDCPIAIRLYWVMRVDGEMKNGGVAQLIWNLHEQYVYAMLYEALDTIGASPARVIVERAVTYIYDTPRRKESFFRDGPFSPAKPLRELTERYSDLSPSVASLLLDFVDASWETPSFHATIDRLDLHHIRHAAFTSHDLTTAVEDGDVKRVASILDAGMDASQIDERNRTLPMIAFGNISQQQSRVDIVEMLMAAGADVNQTTELGTALGRATFYGGERRYLECLVRLGADLEIPDMRGHTPVFGTVKAHENLRYFVGLGADLQRLGASGLTPLGYALTEYRSCFDNKNVRDRLPGLRTSIDLLLDSSCTLGDSPVRASIRSELQTELSFIAVDAELLAHLVAQPGLDGTPEAGVGDGVWNAAYEAAAHGCLGSLEVLASHGLLSDFALARSSLERTAFSGSTPVDVASDDDTRAALIAHGLQAGVQQSHDVWLTASGADPDRLVILVVDAHGATANEASALVAKLPPEPDTTIAWDSDRNLILYDPLLLYACDSRGKAEQLAERCRSRGASVVVL